MMEDDTSSQRFQLLRSLFLRMRVPGFTRRDLLRRYFSRNDDSDIIFSMAFEIINKTNPIITRRRFTRSFKRANEYNADEMYSRFRFTHDQFRLLLTCLNVPNMFHWRWNFTGEESLLLLLRRMASVTTFKQLRQEFRREECELCVCFNEMISWMIDNHGWLITGEHDLNFNYFIIY